MPCVPCWRTSFTFTRSDHLKYTCNLAVSDVNKSYEKWIQNYYTMRSGVFAALSYPAQIVVGLLVHRGMKQTLYGQGTLRYTLEEIASFRQQVWEHVNALVTESRNQCTKVSFEDDGPFWLFGGDAPSEADSVLYGFIASVLVCPA